MSNFPTFEDLGPGKGPCLVHLLKEPGQGAFQWALRSSCSTAMLASTNEAFSLLHPSLISCLLSEHSLGAWHCTRCPVSEHQHPKLLLLNRSKRGWRLEFPVQGAQHGFWVFQSYCCFSWGIVHQYSLLWSHVSGRSAEAAVLLWPRATTGFWKQKHNYSLPIPAKFFF